MQRSLEEDLLNLAMSRPKATIEIMVVVVWRWAMQMKQVATEHC
jgi:hypothetical protein